MTYAFSRPTWNRLSSTWKNNEIPVLDKIAQGFWSSIEGVAITSFSALMANWIFTAPEVINS